MIVVSIFGISKAWALDILPTVTEACEGRNGDLNVINDGFSHLEKCQGNSRRVVMLGQQGPKGDKGDQGEPGQQGPKGDPGDSGFVADKIINVCFHVDTAALTVMKNGTCSPHVHWQIAVKCVPGKPCQPDNPDDPFYDPLQ